MTQTPPDWLTGVVHGAQLGPGTDLGGSARSQVHRHPVLAGPPEWGGSVVLKRFVPHADGGGAVPRGYERERAGLAYLPSAPALLARDDASRTIVMEDLGEHPTLADVLLGRDADTAYQQTLAWAGALGRTLIAAAALPEEARRLLAPAVADDRRTMRRYPQEGVTRLREVAGLRHGRAAAAELAGVVDWLDRDTAKHVLSPGDTCPDNAVLTPGGVRFLDLESTGLRHVALEAAYCAEPFSTCWCVFTPPEGLTSSMLSAFTTGAATQLPGLADDPGWPRQVRAAVALWVVSGAAWLLDGALADRAINGGLGPPFRALLVARWRWVVRHCTEELPDTAALCDEAVTWALRSWRDGSDLTLAPYPAFGAGEAASTTAAD